LTNTYHQPFSYGRRKKLSIIVWLNELSAIMENGNGIPPITCWVIAKIEECFIAEEG
jgi:hypothetical protein